MWDSKIERMSLGKLRKQQSGALKKLANLVYTNVPFYKDRFDKHGVSIQDISSIDDISKLPFTTKQDMREV